MPAALLSEAERAAFARDGYLIVHDLLSDRDIAAFLAAPAVPPHGLRNHVDQPAWARLAAHPAVAGRIGELLGRPPRVVQTMFLDKPPAGGTGVAFHQDEHYLPVDEPTLTACWLALSDTDGGNGGLCVVPGSQRDGLLTAGENRDAAEHDRWETEHAYADRSGRRWTARLAAIALPDLPAERIVRLSVPRGAGVFFGGRLIHGSFANRSPDRPRRAFAIHYVAEGTWVSRCDVQDTLGLDQLPIGVG
jgi:ectoine hydroxylase-related dioxygenase (phytanoyl-CoA dioxygenase family)